MITKQSLQQVIALLIMLSNLLACDKPGEPRATLMEGYLASSKKQKEGKELQGEGLPDGVVGERALNHEIALSEKRIPFNDGSKSPARSYYRYNQDKALADEPMTIIGFPGLTDTNGPTTLIEPLLGKHNIGKSYTMVTRASENENVETHIQNVYKTLREEDRLHDRLLLVPESFGIYPAYGVTMQYSELNIAGMISIHGPWEGVSGAAHIIQAYQKLQTLHLGWLVDSSLDYYQLSNYKIPKALATLGPHGPFLQKVRETLPEVTYPILALAGKSTARTGPYAYLYKLCKESKWSRVYSWGAGMVLGSVDHMIQAYELGNDGLVTTASALAQSIAKKPTHFKGVVADATHFHYELNKYPKLWGEVTDFVKALAKEQVEE